MNVIIFKILFIIALLFKISSSHANYKSCSEAGLNIQKFIESSLGQMLRISKLKIAPEMQNQQIQEIIANCTDAQKVSKRVLGRRKWHNLNAEQQKNFLQQYPIYFIDIFKNVTLSALKGVKMFNIEDGSITNSYDIILIFNDPNKKPLSFTLLIEKRKDRLYITDGQFLDVSIVAAQRDMFDRIYEQNPDMIKNFNAKKFLETQ